MTEEKLKQRFKTISQSQLDLEKLLPGLADQENKLDALIAFYQQELKPHSPRKEAELRLTNIQKELSECERQQDEMLNKLKGIESKGMPHSNQLQKLERQMECFEREIVQAEGEGKDPIRWMLGVENEIRCLQIEVDHAKGLQRMDR